MSGPCRRLSCSLLVSPVSSISQSMDRLLVSARVCWLSVARGGVAEGERLPAVVSRLRHAEGDLREGNLGASSGYPGKGATSDMSCSMT